MTTIAFGAGLIGTDTAAAGKQPAAPLLPVARAQVPALPITALPVTPIRFGEQLLQSLGGAEALATLNVTSRVTGQPKFDAASVEQAEDVTEEMVATDALPVFPSLTTFTQPITVPLEYQQRLTDFSQQSQSLVPVAPLAQPNQPVGLREQILLSVLSAIPEKSALGAVTINAPALSLTTKGTPAVLTEHQSTLPVTQLASLTNAGLAQALVEGMTQQPGVSAPVTTAPAQSLISQRSALEVALGDRLQLQITQRSEHAVIRLDPPSMGTIEIVIQREGGNIQVHLRASNSEVARQLHGIGDSLRQDLVNRQNGDVSVHVSDSSREQHANQQQGQRQSQAQREAPGRALSESNEEAAKSFTLAADEEQGA